MTLKTERFYTGSSNPEDLLPKLDRNSLRVENGISEGDSSSISSAVSAGISSSTNVSLADSKAVSAGTRASVADSKALSVSTLTSTADSKGVSGGTTASTADSGATSKNTSQSTNVSTADSKGISAGTADSLTGSTSVSRDTSLSTVVSTNFSAEQSRNTSQSTNVSTSDSKAVSSGLNTPHDYATGSWTPSIGGTATYTTQEGSYTRIGNLVNIHGHLVINSIGSGSTSAIAGLPYTPALTTAGTVAFWKNFSGTYVFVGCYAAGTSVNLVGATAATSNITSPIAALANSAEIYFNITFLV